MSQQKIQLYQISTSQSFIVSVRASAIQSDMFVSKKYYEGCKCFDLCENTDVFVAVDEVDE